MLTRSELKDIADAIQIFSEQCEATEYTDTDAAWSLLNMIQNMATDALYNKKKLLAEAKKGNRETELLEASRAMFKALNKAVWVPDNIATLIVAERGKPSGFGLAYGKLAEALGAFGPETPEALGAAVFRTIK